MDVAYQDLIRSNEDLAQFASVASHDLQAPVRNIRNAAGLLREDLGHGHDPALGDYVEIIEEGAERMQRLVSSILEYATTSGDDAYDGELTDLGEVVRDVLAERESELGDLAHTIDIGDLPKVAVHPMQAYRVFDNLIGNAIKYRSEERPLCVEVSGSTEGASATVVVADNGIGFDPAHQEAVFTMFRRLHANTIAGSGVGLAIVKRVVERYGGTIRAESEPGTGTRFTMELPAA